MGLLRQLWGARKQLPAARQQMRLARIQAQYDEGVEAALKDGVTREQIDKDPSVLDPYLDGDALEYNRGVATGRNLKAKTAAGTATADDRRAHHTQMGRVGLFSGSKIKDDDPRLAPEGNMSFDMYVQLGAECQVLDPTPDLEERAVELGLPPGEAQVAFDKWSDRVVADKKLYSHYYSRFQQEIAQLAPGSRS